MSKAAEAHRSSVSWAVAVATAAVAVAVMVGGGCYLGVRAGPTLQRGSELDFEGVGWQVSAAVGVQYDFFDRLRVAAAGGGGMTRQGTDRGRLDHRMASGGVELDWTLRDWLWVRNPDRCGAGVGGLGARWRAGAAYRGLRGGDEGTTLTADDGSETTFVGGDGHELELDTEVGVYAGKLNLYVGGGVQWRSTDVAGLGGVDGVTPFVQVAIGFNLFMPRSLTVLMSHHGAVQARDEQAAWRRVDCSRLDDSGERARCEETRDQQIRAWSAEEGDAEAAGARLRAQCAPGAR